MTRLGTLYGIGVGPGDPALLTVKAAGILARSTDVFVPKARTATDSVALSIAGRYIGPGAVVHELVFPMTSDSAELSAKWGQAAELIMEVLREGRDACFLTLGDALLYSTYIYLLREVYARVPDASVVTVPGITAFSASAAATNFAIGEGKDPVTIVPTADDLADVRRALESGGTVVLMKIGKRLCDILGILEETGHIEHAVFVSHVGMSDQRIETDLRTLRGESPEAGYLSIVLVHAGTGEQ